MLEVLRSRAHVILVSRECILNDPAISLALPTFDDTGSLGSPPRQLVYPLGPPWMTASRFLGGNKEGKLNPTTLSSLLLFRVFLSFLFS